MKLPHDPNSESIDPRDFLKEHGEEEFAKRLLTHGAYVIQRQTLNDLCEALRMDLPLLCQGSAGTGKSALAKSVTRAFNLPSTWQNCSEHLSKDELIGRFRSGKQQRDWDYFVRERGMGREEADRLIWTIDYVQMGPLIEAHHYAQTARRPCTATLDEIEKLLTTLEILLYEVLQDKYAHFEFLLPEPVIGILEGSDARPPIRFATSNNMRIGDKRGEKYSLTEPLLDRFYVTFINNPTPRERAHILRARVPEGSRSLITSVVKLTQAIEPLGEIPHKPTLRNTILFTRSLAREQADEVTEALFTGKIAYWGKHPKDRANLLLNARYLTNKGRAPDSTIEAWVDEAFGGKLIAFDGTAPTTTPPKEATVPTYLKPLAFSSELGARG